MKNLILLKSFSVSRPSLWTLQHETICVYAQSRTQILPRIPEFSIATFYDDIVTGRLRRLFFNQMMVRFETLLYWRIRDRLGPAKLNFWTLHRSQ